MNSILHFHAKMRPKTDFSFTLSEWRNPDYVSHGHKALILLLRSASCSLHSEGGKGTQVKWSIRLLLVNLPVGQRIRRVFACAAQAAAPAAALYLYHHLPPPCFLSLLIRFLKGLHSHFVCPLWGKGFAFALFHCCKINQNVCEI